MKTKIFEWIGYAVTAILADGLILWALFLAPWEMVI